jgi:fatty acid desaturase
MIPLGILLYFPFVTGWVWWAVALAYFYFNNFAYKGPFGLMLHCTSHRPWFKSKYKWLNNYLPWVVGPFFGQTPETYFSHHLMMHHLENNLEDDISSTMHYQRDSLRGFFKYYLEFLFLGIISTVQYFQKRHRTKFRNKVIRGEFAFFLFCALLSLISLKATIWVFIVPFMLSRLVMMMGNWAQHAFVDFDDPGNCYKNSVTCINTNYNHKCWNDGYHISHHIAPSLHWTQHPLHLKDNLDEYATNRALVFDGIHFLHIWFYLMKDKYDKLADHVVNINGMYASREEAINLMKKRTAKMPMRGITVESLKKEMQLDPA